MVRNINIRDIPDTLYYKVMGLKAKLNAKTWIDFLEKITKTV